ncbi:hypothetical protein B0H10DRAFT_1948394 [Mycena sp. CBHHK59/15]|nr:hypothetical protein B0H10DRAFT_1948394 [Mycena sp. CBHHK59/15]
MSDIYAEFTEDIASSQPIKCGRLECGRTIYPNDPRHIINNRNPNGLSKTVCEPCSSHYDVKPGTIWRKKANIEADAQDIRRQVTDARDRGRTGVCFLCTEFFTILIAEATNLQHRVTPVPPSFPSQAFNFKFSLFDLVLAYSNMMPPPSIPSGYPRVAVPSSWSGALPFQPPPAQGPNSSSYRYASGYSDAHVSYMAQQEAWARKAYPTNLGETIALVYQVLHEVEGKFKGQLVHNISEGKTIAAGGSSEVKAATPPTLERVEFFPINGCRLDELLQSGESEGGSLTVEYSTTIGVGTFKTAHTGYLTLVHLRTHGLGRVENDCVVAKHMYRSRNPKPGNTGGWVVQTYLVEEFIDTEAEEFVKYIHNGDTGPLLSQEDPFYDIADFLCFTQHVQYLKSSGLVFLSDFQDPQIMTSPDIAKGTDIFGEGNVGAIFLKFLEQHVCSAYCEWFRLLLLKKSEEQA